MAFELKPPNPQPPCSNTLLDPTTTSKDTINSMGSKRQRRPSVRLGDLDDKPLRWKPHRPPSSSSNTRPLTNLILSNGKSNKRPRTNLHFTITHQHEDEEEDQQSPPHDDIDAWQPHNRRSTSATTDTHHHHHRHFDLDEGIRKWLIDLGLARYAPLFQMHEVDDEVLPHLTLDDLKDMGISAVGSRRKLYAAILKLRKGLS